MRFSENGQFPCAVCGQGVGVNSELCNGCTKWCHKRCSGLRSLNAPNLLCLSCRNQKGTSQPNDSIDLHDGQVEEAKSFCFLGDVLHRSGGADRNVRNRIACVWSKWREVSNLLTNRGIPVRHFFYQDLVVTTVVPDLPFAGVATGQKSLKIQKKKNKKGINYLYSHSHTQLLIHSLVLQKW